MADLRWFGNQIMRSVARATAQGVQLCAADLQRKSSEQAPIDTGDLRANCSVSPVTVTPQGIEVEVGYNLPYAIVQHERLDFRHPMGGNAKFLENPLNENADLYKQMIEQKVQDVLKGR